MLVHHLEQYFDFLDELPEVLYSTVVTLRYGTLMQRVKGILWWRRELLAGILPTIEHTLWPEKSISNIIIQGLSAADIVKYCRNEESLVDQILKDICAIIERIEQLPDMAVESLFDQPLLRRTSTADDEISSIPPTQDTPDSKENTPVNFQTQLIAQQQIETKLEQQWSGLLGKWQEVDAIFGEMGTKLGRGWDLSQGVLVSSGWDQLTFYRKLIRNNPIVKDITDSIGRLYEARKDNTPIKMNSRIESEPTIQQQRLESKPILKSQNPMSTQGITRSDDIARMLPQEAAYLGHAKLHMLWHAKRAESTLLSYQVEGVFSQHRPEPILLNAEVPNNEKKSIINRGPIIICVDTSASMQGEPERLAKAIVLEILRLAIGQNRRCYIIAFSGPGQIIEHNLEFGRAGMKALIRFLQQSFFGGTEMLEPIYTALRRINRKKWNQADILFISDGRFPNPGEKLKQIKNECEGHGTHIQAIVIGRWSSQNIEKIASPVYRVVDYSFQISATLCYDKT